MAWDPEQYLSFGNHRLRPALELLGRIPAQAPRRVVDVGCGMGNVTAWLCRRWPQAQVTGIDNSPQMLKKARAALPEVIWQEADFTRWRPQHAVDVLYANAALHWAEGHEALFPRLLEGLAPGGALAVQMPRNFAEPSHTSMGEVASTGPWAKTLVALRCDAPVAEPGFYYDLLRSHCQSVDMWETRYVQVLQGENPVVEYTKGTWLKPLLDALEPPLRETFEATYRARVLEHYPPRSDGSTLFPFNRLFMVAIR